MKKFIVLFICILLILFIAILCMTTNDNKYTSKLVKDIIKNTDVKEVNYLNKYDNYYIVVDQEYIYLFDLKYDEMLSKDIALVHSNDNNYDIIYKDGNLMYFNDYIKKDVLVYEYYDIDTYKLIDKKYIGGNLDE